MKWMKYLFIIILAVATGISTTYAMFEKKNITSPKAKRKTERNNFFIYYPRNNPPILCTATNDIVIDEKTGQSSTFVKPVSLGYIKEYQGGEVSHKSVVRQHLNAITTDNKTYTIGVMDHRLSRNKKFMRAWHSLPANLDADIKIKLERIVMIDAYNAQATHLTSLDLNTNETAILELKENM